MSLLVILLTFIKIILHVDRDECMKNAQVSFWIRVPFAQTGIGARLFGAIFVIPEDQGNLRENQAIQKWLKTSHPQYYITLTLF